MEASFWYQRWESGEIAFHANEVNALLIKNFKKLNLPQGSRILIPLCGKTLDIAWLLANGYRVVGAELSKIAVTELFESLGIEPDIFGASKLDRYSAKDIDIFVGDFFDVTAEMIGHVNAVYDRAALVALPSKMRDKYTSHLIKITHKVPQLLITYEYNQQLMNGPPFSISEDEVKHHYADAYELKALLRHDVVGGLKNKVKSIETVWLLK